MPSIVTDSINFTVNTLITPITALVTMPEIVDDKSQYCIPFLLERLRVHAERHRQPDGSANAPPFFLGLNGVQGAGKTVLVSCAIRPTTKVPTSGQLVGTPSSPRNWSNMVLRRCQRCRTPYAPSRTRSPS